MARLGKFPFTPDMTACKMVVRTDGAVCYIMDTCCRNFTKEDKARVDRQIIEIAVQSAIRKNKGGLA